MRRKRFHRRARKNDEMALQITSMADIFIILLVFLLKSFSTGLSTILPSTDLTLPQADSKDEVTETLKVEISKDSILVDDKPATVLKEFVADPGDLETDGTFRSLNTALIAQQQRSPASSDPATATPPAAPELDADGKPYDAAKPLTILADQKAPYSLVRAVMSSAENSGFNQFKLVVVQDQ